MATIPLAASHFQLANRVIPAKEIAISPTNRRPVHLPRHNDKTHVHDCHVVPQEKNSRKLAIVSAAFERPKWADDSLADKLARLNQVLLYRTLSIEERVEYGFWVDFSQDQWKDEFGSRHYMAVKAAAIRCGMIDSNEKYSTGLYDLEKTVEPFPKSVRLRLDYRDGRTKELSLKRGPRSKKKPLNEKNLRLAGCHLARMLCQFHVVGQPKKSSWDALAKRFFNAGFHRPFRCKYDRFHSTASALPSYLRSTLVANKETHMDTVEEESPPPPDFRLTSGFPPVPRRGLAPEFGLDDTGVIGPIRARKLRNDVLQAKALICRATSKKTGLVHLDIANCQSLCIAAMAIERYGRRLPADAVDWLDLCEAGQLYEAIRDWLAIGDIPPYKVQCRGRTFTIDPSRWDRARVKHQFMVAIFGRLEQSAACPIWLAVERMFPTIAELFLSTKRGGHQYLAHRCQRMESAIIIDGVCGHLAQAHPDLPVLTVHDCLIVPQHAESLIRELLAEFFGRQGVTPFVRQEELA